MREEIMCPNRTISKQCVLSFYYVNIGVISDSCSDIIIIDHWKTCISWPLIQECGARESFVWRCWKWIKHALFMKERRNASSSDKAQYVSGVHERCQQCCIFVSLFLAAIFYCEAGCGPVTGWPWGGGGGLEGGGHSVTLTNCLVIFLWSHNLDWNNHIKTQANMSTSAHATSAQISQCAGFSSSYAHFILHFYPLTCTCSVRGW